MVNIKEHIQKGFIHTRVVLEIIGKPKEHVEKAINGYIEKINKNENLIIIAKQVSEIKQVKDKDLFSVFSELEILVKGFKSLTQFCFNYMPASIEILEPNRLIVDANKMTNLFNDFQGKLHKADFLAKSLQQQNNLLVKNFDGLIKNMLVILLKDKGMTLENISRYTGLKPEDIIKIIEGLIKEKKIRKIGEKYFYEF